MKLRSKALSRKFRQTRVRRLLRKRRSKKYFQRLITITKIKEAYENMESLAKRSSGNQDHNSQEEKRSRLLQRKC